MTPLIRPRPWRPDFKDEAVSGVLRRGCAVISVITVVVLLTMITSAGQVFAATIPCGTQTVTNPDGGTWNCTLDDEFSGSKLDATKWTIQTTAASGFTDGSSCFTGNSQNVSVSSGHLNLTVRRTSKASTCVSPLRSFATKYSAGEVMTYQKFFQAYGRFQVRAAFPSTARAGLQSSLWLYPEDGLKYGAWPKSGEIDIAEEYSRYNTRAVPYVHYASAGLDTNMTNTNCLVANVSLFHTYQVDWTPTSITVTYDGKQCIKDTWTPAAPLVAPQPFDSPFMVALTAALGTGDDAVTNSTPLPATTKIDWVRVWG